MKTHIKKIKGIEILQLFKKIINKFLLRFILLIRKRMRSPMASNTDEQDYSPKTVVFVSFMMAMAAWGMLAHQPKKQ